MAIRSQDGIPPYLLGNKGYPLLPWLMTPHKENGEVHSVLQLLYSHKHKKGRSIVDNVFDILKQTFRKLLEKTKLHIIIVLSVFFACCLFHNLLFWRKKVDVEELM
jgi:5-carboxymethyl-2-hydroxymuconate isomerase